MNKHKPKRRVGIGMGLFLWFVGSAAVCLALFLGAQLLFFDYFYQSATTYQMEKAAEEIAEAYVNDVSPKKEQMAETVRKNQFSVSVFLMNEKDNNLFPDVLFSYYDNESAINSLGNYEFREAVRRLYLQVKDTENTVIAHDDARIFCATLLRGDGKTPPVMVLLDAPMYPLNITRDILSYQIIIVTLFTLLVACFISLFVSRFLSKPLIRIKEAAKELPQGKYDNPDRGNYREIDEISDTLERAAEELSATDRYQKELIANVSHDLRTPLTMIIGYGEVMRDIESERTPENVQIIMDEAQRLSGIVNDLLELSRYQAGHGANDNREIFDLSDAVSETVERYRRMKAVAGFEFSFESDGASPIFADRGKIMQVFCNLVNNAVNYSGDSRKIEIECRKQGESQVTVSVRDYGVGIAKEDLGRVFDRYYKVDKTHARARIGTGIGLSIVKEILESYSADYGVTSEMGKGSTFSFTLPLALYGEERESDGNEKKPVDNSAK